MSQESKGEIIDPKTKKASIDVLNNYYEFSVSGVLVANVHISIFRYEDAGEESKLLGGIQNMTEKAGNSYTIKPVSSYTYAGVNYQLSKIYVDDVMVEPGSFNDILTKDEYTDVARKNSEIKLFYAPVAADAAPAQG